MTEFKTDIHDIENPLVSVLVYNYNYGRYLEECLDSIISQTYKNIEILCSDNASTDNSWDVMLSFVQKYPGRITVIRNLENLGGAVNFNNCFYSARGTYYIPMCSDDVMAPDYIEKCISVFKKGPNLGYVMVHHALIDAEGKRTDIAPFYEKSCIIKGEEQAAVYMMATVNPSISQVMYHKIRTSTIKTPTCALANRWYGARLQDFNLCTHYPMAYIKEPLLKYRIHGDNDSLNASENLLEIIGPYILQHQFSDIGNAFNMPGVSARLPESIDKLGALSIRYCVRYLLEENEGTAKRYFHLALAVSPKVSDNDNFQKLKKYWLVDDAGKDEILNEFKEKNNFLTREVSYSPPEGSLII